MATSRMIYNGSGIKVKLSIICDGFDMYAENAQFSVKVYNDVHEQTIDKSQMVKVDDGYVFTIDTTDFGPGTYYMETTAHVPDRDFGEDFTRTEIDKQRLCIVDQ